MHDCDLATAKRLAGELGVPLSSLYADTDVMARAIQASAALSARQQSIALEELVAKAAASKKRSRK